MHPSPFSVASQTRATSSLSLSLPLRISTLFAATVADLKTLLFKEHRRRRSRRGSLESTIFYSLGTKFHSRHSSDLDPELISASNCSTGTTMPVKSINYVSSQVIGGVKSIPRRASRLVCITDSGHSPVEVEFPLPSDRSSGSSDTATVVSTSSGGSGSHDACRIQSAVLEASQVSMTSSAHSAPTPYKPAPIITVDQLQQAMDRKSMTFESSFDASDVVSTPTTPMQAPKPHASNGLSIEVLLANSSTNSRTNSRPQTIATNDLELPQREEEDLSPRPLSPPPSHFRRRVLSNNTCPGTAGITCPYTTPINSPPASPCPEPQNNKRSIGLHEILSMDDLVAPRRLTLYKPPAEERESLLSVRPERYDTGMEIRRVLSR